MAGSLEVALTKEQLHALCLAVALHLQEGHLSPELAGVRPALESVEERLVNAWADAQLAGWVGTCGQSGVV